MLDRKQIGICQESRPFQAADQSRKDVEILKSGVAGTKSTSHKALHKQRHEYDDGQDTESKKVNPSLLRLLEIGNRL